MAHLISGLVGRPEALRSLPGSHGLPAAELGQGYLLLALDAAGIQTLLGSPTTGTIVDVEPIVENEGENFRELTVELVEFLRQASRDREFVYLETEYFGGAGGQGAIVFPDGAIVFGPTYGRIGVINEALALIGVAFAEGAIDEFDAVGLTDIRSNDLVRKARPRGAE